MEAQESHVVLNWGATALALRQGHLPDGLKSYPGSATGRLCGPGQVTPFSEPQCLQRGSSEMNS